MRDGKIGDHGPGSVTAASTTVAARLGFQNDYCTSVPATRSASPQDTGIAQQQDPRLTADLNPATRAPPHRPFLQHAMCRPPTWILSQNTWDKLDHQGPLRVAVPGARRPHAVMRHTQTRWSVAMIARLAADRADPILMHPQTSARLTQEAPCAQLQGPRQPRRHATATTGCSWTTLAELSCQRHSAPRPVLSTKWRRSSTLRSREPTAGAESRIPPPDPAMTAGPSRRGGGGVITALCRRRTSRTANFVVVACRHRM